MVVLAVGPGTLSELPLLMQHRWHLFTSTWLLYMPAAAAEFQPEVPVSLRLSSSFGFRNIPHELGTFYLATSGCEQ